MRKGIYLAVAIVAMMGCAKQESTSTNNEERVEVIKTITLQPREIERVINISSNLEGYQTVNISPSIQGKIEHIYVEVGDHMKTGDDLVRMDQNQVNTTSIAMANLEVEMSRMDALLASGSVSQQSYDQVKTSYDQTKESLSFLKKNTYVKAPFNGVISAKNYEDGELYAGQPIVVIKQVDRLKALVAIPETYIPRVKAGMHMEVRSEIYPDKVFPATVEVVYPTVDASTHTFQCKVVIPNAQNLLRPGMYITTTLGLGKENAIVVPYQTVEKLVGANDRYVFLVQDSVAKRVPVQLGQRFDEEIEIIAPEIVAGAEYVVQGQHRLVDGVKVKVVNQ